MTRNPATSEDLARSVRDLHEQLPIALNRIWNQLGTVRRLRFHASSVGSSGWNGAGDGSVVVAKPNSDTITFDESGEWSSASGNRLRFTNSYRWTMHYGVPSLRLEHLRFGTDRPVELFDLVAAGKDRLVSANPHVCKNDLYAAILVIRETEFELTWSIQGPQKNETIVYFYD